MRDSIINKETANKVIKLTSNIVKKEDLDFYWRVWEKDISIYVNRLRLIEFENMEKVLDAGSGMGQWTVSLSLINKYVCSIEINENRVNVIKNITKLLDINNVEILNQSIEDIEYPDKSFDGIFCYSVLYLSDFKKSLNEFARLLKI